MKILSIETSCDETAVSIVEATGGLESPTFSVLGNSLLSQIDIHKEYGGVFPMLAKREHAKNLPTLLKRTLEEAGMYTPKVRPLDANSSRSNLENEEKWQEIKEVLAREDTLYENLRAILEHIRRPDVDVIAVTSGPGLVPALWVGISCATALGKLWDIPVVGANHMEGHITSVLVNTDGVKSEKLKVKSNTVELPALALLISGGHTELVEITNWGEYRILGQTRDDAVGEAFDKTARLLGLPYPGGPEISRLAEEARSGNLPKIAEFPRPMIHSQDFDFSFSGLKTSVLYYIRDNFNNDNKTLGTADKQDIAREFEDTVVDVLLTKTLEALEQTGAKTLIIAGGVIANKKLREVFSELETTHQGLIVKIPTKLLSTDNALMIASATYVNLLVHPELIKQQTKIIANGNLRLDTDAYSG
jgi:N6-L-threonylcarbamoyladenine synthase